MLANFARSSSMARAEDAAGSESSRRLCQWIVRSSRDVRVQLMDKSTAKIMGTTASPTMDVRSLARREMGRIRPRRVSGSGSSVTSTPQTREVRALAKRAKKMPTGSAPG